MTAPSDLLEATAQGKTLEDFNSEQQADILADYYVLKSTNQNTEPYDPYVKEVQDGIPLPFIVHVRRTLLGF